MFETLLCSCVHVVSCCLATLVNEFVVAIAVALKRSVICESWTKNKFECIGMHVRCSDFGVT